MLSYPKWNNICLSNFFCHILRFYHDLPFLAICFTFFYLFYVCLTVLLRFLSYFTIVPNFTLYVLFYIFLTSFTLFAMFYVLDPILRFLACFAFFVFFLHLSSYFTSLLSYCRVFDSTHKQGITLFASS